jgi:hypothetical protein
MKTETLTRDDLLRARPWKHRVRIFIPLKRGLPMLALDRLDELLLKKVCDAKQETKK